MQWIEPCIKYLHFLKNYSHSKWRMAAQVNISSQLLLTKHSANFFFKLWITEVTKGRLTKIIFHYYVHKNGFFFFYGKRTFCKCIYKYHLMNWSQYLKLLYYLTGTIITVINMCASKDKQRNHIIHIEALSYPTISIF